MSDIFQVTGCRCQGMGSGGLQRWPLRSWVCPMQNTAASSQLQQSHCRVQLIPSAMYVAPLGNKFKGKVPYGSVRTEKNSVRTSSADTKDTKEGGGGCTPEAAAEIPLQPMEDAVVELISTLQTLESLCWNSLILKDCSPWNDRLEQSEQEGIFLKSNPFCP